MSAFSPHSFQLRKWRIDAVGIDVIPAPKTGAPNHAIRTRRLLKKTIDSGRQQEFVEVAPVDGKPVIYLSVINPTKDSNDKITGVAVNVVKITPDMLQKLNQTMHELDN
jgi:hypothetical protein